MATGTTSVLKRALIERFLVDVPPASRAYITDHKPTCEDMTLHFLASNATRQPPIWFELHSTDGGELDKAPDAGDGGRRPDAPQGRGLDGPARHTNCRMGYKHAARDGR
ncbi:glucuronosyl-N-acetylglucosaminyl-proteoglycan 4-alpha-N-acetylglucosaminyltransferase [Aureococcus anophagefferens]|nr:glucuronosyl-N-acetylglucosaminyl-proteoglycan 4-alpha-N-acetylglucosaminyltransferase [Aureococcus anophagefferens]